VEAVGCKGGSSGKEEERPTRRTRPSPRNPYTLGGIKSDAQR